MISLKRMLEHRSDATAAASLLEASSRLRHALLDGIAVRARLVDEARTPHFELTSRDLLRRLEEAAAPVDLVNIASEALEANDSDTQGAKQHLRLQNSQMQSIVAMLTEALADISGRSGEAVTRLQAIEQQIERASGLEDIQPLKASLASCLADVKEAALQHRKGMLATVEHLHDHIRSTPQPAAALVSEARAPGHRGAEADYVVTFKLQRADQVLARFGERVRDQLLSLMNEGLKPAQGPHDRLMRWKGPSYVMLLSSVEAVPQIRRRLAAEVAKIGQRYIEVGKNSALLAVGVDWVIFPQADYPSLDLLFAEVDSFLNE